MEFVDKILKCADCSQDFTFTADEQKFYQEKGFQNEPKRCISCRKSKRLQGRGDSGKYHTRTEIICASCGQKSEVPFKPVQNRPVYCNECFTKTKEKGIDQDNKDNIAQDEVKTEN